LGPSLPPVELARQDSTLFVKVKCLFSNMSEVRKETEANGGHQDDRTLHRTRSRFDRMLLVSSTQQSGARVLEFATSASGPSQNRSIRSGTQRSRAWRRADRTRGASGHTRSDASGHTRLDAGTVTSGRCVERVRSCCRARGCCAYLCVRSVERRIRSSRLTVGA
jgi:hypothetical protein